MHMTGASGVMWGPEIGGVVAEGRRLAHIGAGGSRSVGVWGLGRGILIFAGG